MYDEVIDSGRYERDIQELQGLAVFVRASLEMMRKP